MTDRAALTLKAAYYCCSEVLRSRERTGQPIPPWLRQHYNHLDAQIRMSPPGHESDCARQQSDPQTWITAKEAATMLVCSTRHARRLAADLDGQLIGGRLLFDRVTIAEYVEGKRSA